MWRCWDVVFYCYDGCWIELGSLLVVLLLWFVEICRCGGCLLWFEFVGSDMRYCNCWME